MPSLKHLRNCFIVRGRRMCGLYWISAENKPIGATNTMSDIPENQREEIEAAVYRRLVEHLRSKPEVQNIDLMNLADFCRNCLSKWYVAAAEERGVALNYDTAREIVYGMPYAEWKSRYQKEATPEQMAAFEAREKAKQAS